MLLQFINKSRVLNNYLVVLIVYLKLLKCPIEDNKALMTASYLLVSANFNTIKLWSALMAASYLLNVLSSVFSGCRDFRLLYANNIMSGGIFSSFKVVRMPY